MSISAGLVVIDFDRPPGRLAITGTIRRLTLDRVDVDQFKICRYAGESAAAVRYSAAIAFVRWLSVLRVLSFLCPDWLAVSP